MTDRLCKGCGREVPAHDRRAGWHRPSDHRPATPAPDALDVERLARAMNAAWEPDDVFIDDIDATWQPFAAKVARAYAEDDR